MAATAYLRVYLPLEAFDEAERGRWARQAEGELPDNRVARRWLVSASLPAAEASADGAFVRQIEDRVYVCPWRTRLRMLAGLLAFRNSVPEEIADAFVPEVEARKAAREIQEMGRSSPNLRSHILHANWHVPLRWFAAFAASQRVLVEDKEGLRIRYETDLTQAFARMTRALEILEGAGLDEGIIAALRELLEWLDGFPGDGLLELDYSSVARIFDDEDLVEDHSCAEVWACLDALVEGDLVRAGETFGSLTDRWNAARSSEVLN